MKIVADENITLVHEVFGVLGEVQTFAGRVINAEHLKEADVLLVRSVTRVDADLLEGSRVKFVGTCTIGTDHVDLAYLQKQGIGFSSAPGCNANAVVDYVLSVLATLALEQGFDVANKKVGIVGIGNVGRRLKMRLEGLGVTCLCCDPLLEANDELQLHSLEEVMSAADIISLHTPLTRNGLYPTYHLVNEKNLASFKPGAILINSSRGAVVDNQALKRFLAQGGDMTAVLDVWEHEPDIDLALVSRVALATPHIAGYSLDGKIAGTMMIYQALCDFFEQIESVDVASLAPPSPALSMSGPDNEDVQLSGYRSVLQCYDVRRDDDAFRQVMVAGNLELAASFDRLRKEYPVRRELGVTRPGAGMENAELVARLSALGFCC